MISMPLPRSYKVKIQPLDGFGILSLHSDSAIIFDVHASNVRNSAMARQEQTFCFGAAKYFPHTQF